MHLIGGHFDIASKPGERHEDSGESSHWAITDRRSSRPAIESRWLLLHHDGLGRARSAHPIGRSRVAGS